jgi:putative addiction module killer protein
MEVTPIFVEFYRDTHFRCPFKDWLMNLAPPARSRITARLIRLQNGSLGDVKPIGEGLSELRIDFGVGYRVYLSLRKQHALVLLGSDKPHQERTIELAKDLWKEWKSKIS